MYSQLFRSTRSLDLQLASCEAEPFPWGIWYECQVDTVRTEMHYRTPSRELENCLAREKKNPNIWQPEGLVR